MENPTTVTGQTETGVAAVLAAFPNSRPTARRGPGGFEHFWARLAADPWMPTVRFADPQVQRGRRMSRTGGAA